MKIRLTESKLPEPQRNQLIKEFVKFCISELGVKNSSGSKIVLTNNPNKTQTYAHFQPSNNQIVVYKGDRAFGDYARSLAHELYHMNSNLKGTLHAESGEDGSDEENGANSFAGIVMRKWGKMHPESLEK